MSDHLRTFDAFGKAYDEAFRAFLSHTNQKKQANEFLLKFVKRLKSHEVFVDVGAGEGVITKLLTAYFSRTIAIEPNPLLAKNLISSQGIEVIEGKIGSELKVPPADFVLCSHVFYLLEPTLWLPTILQMANWLAPEGSLVILNQSEDTDCRRLARHFYGEQPHPNSLYKNVGELLKASHDVRLEVIPSEVVAPDATTACRIAEFLLGGNENRPAPSKESVKEHLDSNFRIKPDGYLLSCHQDALILTRRVEFFAEVSRKTGAT